MKSYILLQTAAIYYLTNLYLKQGIGSLYVKDVSHLQWLPRAVKTRVEQELQNEKFLPTLGFEPGTIRLRSERATTELQGLISVEWIKVHLLLSVLFLENNLQHMVDVAK